VYNGHHATATVPRILGHEFSGEIYDIKSKSDRLEKGDKVVVQPYFGCGVCDLCVDGRDNICSELKILGIHVDGCFAQYVKVPASKVYKVPDDMDLKLAAMAEPLAVAIHDVRRSKLKVGDKTLIIGGGPIGLLIAMVARQAGAGEVIISEINEYRIKFAQDLGFKTVNPKSEGFMDELLNCTDGKGYDVVFEVTGVKPSQLLMTKACRIGGTVMLVGFPSEPHPVNVVEAVSKELNLRGVRIHAQVNFSAAVDMLVSGKINDEIEKVITHSFRLDEFSEAIDFSFNDQQHFKVMIEI